MGKVVNTHFPVGTLVAVIEHRSQRRIRKSKVFKVRRDGKFFLLASLAGQPAVGTTMYTPDGRGGPTAEQSGYKGHYGTHVEPWTSKHEEEIRQRNAEVAHHQRAQELINWLEANRRLNPLTNGALVRTMHDMLPPKAATGEKQS